MRRMTVQFGKSGPKISGLTKVRLPTVVQEPLPVKSAPDHCGIQPKTMCCLQFIVLMSSRELGVALRAGLLAALKPRKRVFPLAGCHP